MRCWLEKPFKTWLQGEGFAARASNSFSNYSLWKEKKIHPDLTHRRYRTISVVIFVFYGGENAMSSKLFLGTNAKWRIIFFSSIARVECRALKRRNNILDLVKNFLKLEKICLIFIKSWRRRKSYLRKWKTWLKILNTRVHLTFCRELNLIILENFC